MSLFCKRISFSRFPKTLGKDVKMTAAVMIPATRSAIPSERNTPLKPINRVRIKHSGMSMTTFLMTASISAVLACPSAMFTFCKVIWTKNMIDPMRKKGVYFTTIALTSSLAENNTA